MAAVSRIRLVPENGVGNEFVLSGGWLGRDFTDNFYILILRFQISSNLQIRHNSCQNLANLRSVQISWARLRHICEFLVCVKAERFSPYDCEITT